MMQAAVGTTNKRVPMSSLALPVCYLRVTSIETSTDVEQLSFPMRGERVRCVEGERWDRKIERGERGNVEVIWLHTAVSISFL